LGGFQNWSSYLTQTVRIPDPYSKTIVLGKTRRRDNRRKAREAERKIATLSERERNSKLFSQRGLESAEHGAALFQSPLSQVNEEELGFESCIVFIGRITFPNLKERKPRIGI
jgi:hypothetical protein